jgi:G3E family GTPase
VEASGVALPGAVAASLTLLAGVALDAVLVLADAETVRARAADRYLADTIARQLAAADLVVLNKVDLVAPRARAALHAWLETMAPGATVIDALRAQLPLEAVLGIETGARRGTQARRLQSAALQPPATAIAEALFEQVETVVEQRVDARGLATALADPALGLVRAKGILRDRDGTAVVLQVVGARSGVEPLSIAGAASGRLVCIGLKGRLDRAALRAALDRATGSATNLKEC